MVLFNTCCTILETSVIVLQALSLIDLSPWIYLSLPLYIHRGWFRSYLTSLAVFPAFFILNLCFAIRSLRSEPQSAPGLIFAHCIQLLHLQLQRMQSVWYQNWPFGNALVYSHLLFCQKGCLPWSVHSLSRIWLAFHFVLQVQTCLFLQVSFDFLLLHSNLYDE